MLGLPSDIASNRIDGERSIWKTQWKRIQSRTPPSTFAARGRPFQALQNILVTLQSIGAIGWLQSANRLEFPIGSGGGDRPIGCGRPNCRLLDVRLAVADSKKSSSQKCSRQNSVQNAPIGIFAALMETVFVTISVFLYWANVWTTVGPIGSIGQADQGWEKSIGSIGQG